MIHIYKQGGPYKAGDIEYSLKSVANKDAEYFLNKGWAKSLNTMPIEAEFEVVEKQAVITELTEDEQKQILMDKLDEYGIHANSRWGLDTLQNKLSEMQNGDNNKG
jgi:hypothetical protein